MKYIRQRVSYENPEPCTTANMATNLNKAFYVDRDGDGTNFVRPAREHSKDGSVIAVFQNLEKYLIAQINTADVVVGCVAWLTNDNILDALAKKNGVSIIVQKEDFLRPDYDAQHRNITRGWQGRLQKKYGNLPPLYRCDFPLLSGMSSSGDQTLDAVRCVGNHNIDKAPAFPRAHHKFVVFGKHITWQEQLARHPDIAKAYYTNPYLDDDDPDTVATYMLDDGTVVPDVTREQLEQVCNHFSPFDRVRWLSKQNSGDLLRRLPSYDWYAAWTGSFNFTKNAGRSFENAVVLYDPAMVQAFLHEFCHVAAFSEPLNWEAEWMAPEWRLGT